MNPKITLRKHQINAIAHAPYSYIKDPQNRHTLLVDPEAAEVVKQIFTMLLGGMTKSVIVMYLNEHGILSPSEHKRSNPDTKRY